MHIYRKVFLIITMIILLTSCALPPQKSSTSIPTIPKPDPLPALPKRPPVNFRIEGTTAYVSVDEYKALMEYVLDLEERSKAADSELRKIHEALQ